MATPKKKKQEAVIGTYDEFLCRYLPRTIEDRKTPEEKLRDALKRILSKVGGEC